MSPNLILLVLETLVFGGLALALHSRSRKYGLAPLLIYLSGLVAVLQTLGYVPIFVDAAGVTFEVSSITLVPVIQMAVLILYVADGTAAARVTILGIASLSGLVLGIQAGRQWHLHLPGGFERLGLGPDNPAFQRSLAASGASLVAALVSLGLALLVYQALANRARWIPGWVLPGVALTAGLMVDDFVFRVGMTGWADYVATFPGGAPSKVVGAVLLWPMAAAYLARVAPSLPGYLGSEERPTLDVIFGSYRRKEVARVQAEKGREESEVRFRGTFEHAAVGLLHTDLEGRIVLANRAACAILATTEQDLRGRPFPDLHVLADRERAAQEMQELVDGVATTISVDRFLLRDDAAPIWIRQTLSLVRGDDFKPRFFVAVLEDLTERQITEEQLRQAQKMEAVGQLTGGVAHDFNNLLTVVVSGLELALDEPDPSEERRHSLREALAAAERGASLVQRLLAFSRRQPLRPVPVDPAELLEDMRELLERTLGDGILIRVNVVGAVGLCLADLPQLESALLNLALNSRDAMPNGGLLTLQAEQVEATPPSEALEEPLPPEPRLYVRFTVTDQGEGIHPDLLPRVTEPFFTTKPVGKGSGLGLSMVYGFAQQSEGFLVIESEPGKGTSVHLHLPVTADTFH